MIFQQSHGVTFNFHGGGHLRLMFSEQRLPCGTCGPVTMTLDMMILVHEEPRIGFLLTFSTLQFEACI